MTEPSLPWWASTGAAEGRLAPDEDPVERFLAARRGEAGRASGARGQARTEPWLEAMAASVSRLARDLAGGDDDPPGRAPADDDAGGERGAGPGAEEAPETSAGPGAGSPGAERPGPGAAPTGDGGEGAHAAGGRPPPPHGPEVCGVCPLCLGLRALAESRPELVGHLAEAARQVALAARALRERPWPDDEPLEHIDLD